MPPVPIARPNALLRELVTLVVVVAAAALVGFGLGVILNHAFGTPKPSSAARRAAAVRTTTPAVAPTTSPTTASTGAATSTPATTSGTTAASTTSTTTPSGAGTATPVRTTIDMGQQLTFSVTRSTLVTGTTPGAARLTVEATVENTGTATVTPPIDHLFIRYGGSNVRPDPNATAVAGALLQPLAPGRTATGELHFEARGAVTAALKGLPQAAIRFGPQTLVIPLR